ncbi:MAG: lipopolysaccharide biosynthesis protein [Sandaracinaceae bacterium]
MPHDDESRADEGQRAGRGALVLMAAKVLFVLTGWGAQVALPRILGSDEEFGLYSVALGATSMLTNLIVASTIQTVSKLVSEDEDRAPATLRQGLYLQATLGATLGGAFFLAAPWLAGSVLLDDALGPVLRVSSAAVASYALYAALVGSLNGRRRFRAQAFLDMTFSILRVTGILTGAALLGGALGAMSGFATAAVSILVLALVAVGTGRGGATFPPGRWAALMGPIVVYQLFLNGIMQVDLQVLKRTLAELARLDGVTATAAAAVANEAAAHYRAAQLFAFVPYQLILSLTFILLPYVSRAHALGDGSATRRHIERALRISLLVLLSMAAPMAGTGSGVIRVVFPPSFAPGGQALSVLAFGMAAFGLWVVAATVLVSVKRPSLAAATAGIALVVVIAATRALLWWAPGGLAPLVAAALGTTLGTLTALALVGAVLRRMFGAFLPPLTVLRAGAASGAAFALCWLLPTDAPLPAIGALLLGFAVYGVVLGALRELDADDLALARRILGRRGRREP